MSERTWQDAIDEVKALEEANKPYYRLFIDRDDKPVVVCLQPFDEADYDQSRFINKKQYETEEAAEKALLSLMVGFDILLSMRDRWTERNPSKWSSSTGWAEIVYPGYDSEVKE